MATKTVTDTSFGADVLEADGPVLVDFWAEWCGPCKMIGPALEQISDEMAGRVTIAKVNIDDNPDTPSKYGVRGIPQNYLIDPTGKIVAVNLKGETLQATLARLIK